jgi:hypothetical protein
LKTIDKPKKSDPLSQEEVAKLLDSLTIYEKELEKAEERVTMRGKSLAEAQKEQTAWPVFYGMKRAEIYVIFKRLDSRVAAIRGRLHRFYKEHDSLGSSERQIDKYVDANEEFLAANELLLHVEEIYKKYNEVIENGFDKRGFALRDFTQARVHEIHNEIL